MLWDQKNGRDDKKIILGGSEYEVFPTRVYCRQEWRVRHKNGSVVGSGYTRDQAIWIAKHALGLARGGIAIERLTQQSYRFKRLSPRPRASHGLRHVAQKWWKQP